MLELKETHLKFLELVQLRHFIESKISCQIS